MYCNEMDRSVEYKCDQGFGLVGATSSICSNGQWSPAPPQCVRDSPCDRNPGENLPDVMTSRFCKNANCVIISKPIVTID